MRNDSLDAFCYAAPIISHHKSTMPIGKVMNMKERDKGLTITVSCNPDMPKWLKYIVQENIEYSRRRTETSYTNHILYNKQEETKMSKAENEYLAKKNLLKVEQAEKENEFKMKYDSDLIALRKEYGQKFDELEKEKEDAENKEKADAHAKAVKDAYDAYIAQGFTKTQAESFIKIALENG